MNQTTTATPVPQNGSNVKGYFLNQQDGQLYPIFSDSSALGGAVLGQPVSTAQAAKNPAPVVEIRVDLDKRTPGEFKYDLIEVAVPTVTAAGGAALVAWLASMVIPGIPLWALILTAVGGGILGGMAGAAPTIYFVEGLRKAHREEMAEHEAQAMAKADGSTGRFLDAHGLSFELSSDPQSGWTASGSISLNQLPNLARAVATIPGGKAFLREQGIEVPAPAPTEQGQEPTAQDVLDEMARAQAAERALTAELARAIRAQGDIDSRIDDLFSRVADLAASMEAQAVQAAHAEAEAKPAPRKRKAS